MTNNELDEIELRADSATPGPWYWREGKHTADWKTSDSGGLQTRTPMEDVTPDGRRYDNDNVIFPYGRIGGEAYWVERYFKATGSGKSKLSIALECHGKDADKEFIARAREDIPALIAEIYRLRKLLGGLGD